MWSVNWMRAFVLPTIYGFNQKHVAMLWDRKPVGRHAMNLATRTAG
jgi:hypothetical protein